MKKIKLLLLLLVVLQTSFVAAQKVSNINYSQEQSTIIVSYDLETKTPCKVNLFVSTNGGTTWQGPLTKVTGDVGAKIVSGSHNITWNVLEEFEELRGDKIQFQVRALGILDLPIKTLKIGTQEWTTKNLDVSRYRNGDIIPEVKDLNEWSSLTTGAWCYYNNDPRNGKIYGKLYNWYAVNDPRELAPEGYHIPSVNEWEILINYLGGKNSFAGIKMKEKGTLHWINPQYQATNSSGFTGLPGGVRYGSENSFELIGYVGYWWSSSKIQFTDMAWYCGLHYLTTDAKDDPGYKTTGFSVRCLKD